MKNRIFAVLVALLVSSPIVAHSTPVKWSVIDAVFNDGTTLTGWFIFDADTGSYTDSYIDWSLVTQDGTGVANPYQLVPPGTAPLAGVTYDPSNSTAANFTGIPGFGIEVYGNQSYVWLRPLQALTSAGGTVLLQTGDPIAGPNSTSSYECDNCNYIRHLISGYVTASAAPQGPYDPQVRPDPGQVVPISPNPLDPVSPTKVSLIVAVHGWNSSADVWPNALVQSMRASIRQQQESGQSDSTERWSLIAYDWSSGAGFGGIGGLPKIMPWTAHANAEDQGRRLGQLLAPAGYDRIHFVAHSAGSALVESAAKWLRSSGAKQPFIHTTFLDAYHPAGENAALYGQSSNWAEQYVDLRDSLSAVAGWGSLENTNLTLPRAFNFDVTSLDQRTDVQNVVQAHAWPYLWYTDTSEVPSLWQYGWGASLEYDKSRLPTHTDLARGGKCKLVAVNTACSGSASVLRRLVFSPVADLFDPWLYPSSVSASKSTTGTASTSTPQQIILTVGSPVWITLQQDVTTSFNALQFSYRFTGGDEGLLSVFVDDRLVFRADQRYAETSGNWSDVVPVGDINGGKHSITFRLDHYAASSPTVVISDISYGVAVLAEASNAAPVADAGLDRSAQTGSRIQLDGSGSRDPDNGPLPLVYEWEQLSGPTVRLENPMSSAPHFTATTDGIYVFALVVHDGNESSVPARVQVTTVTSDGSPPVITPTVRGAIGANGWYTSDVQVSWVVTDAESAVSSQTGCGSVTVNTDTAGTSFTCTATSAGGTTSQSVTIKRDATPPTLVFGTPSPAASFSGWHKGGVEIPYTAQDATSGVASTEPGSPVAVAMQGASVTRTVTVTDNAGNSATFTTPPVNIDGTVPAILISTPSAGSTYLLNGQLRAGYSCSDAVSGVASCVGTISNGASVDTAVAGSFNFKVEASDHAGNTSSKTHRYSIMERYAFGGFFSPVDNPPVVNKTKAGLVVPVKWSLIGGDGRYVSSLTSFTSLTSRPVTCDSGLPSDPIEQTLTSGGSRLRYDQSANQFVYNWKTSASWRGTCRMMELALKDGQKQQAVFRFQ